MIERRQALLTTCTARVMRVGSPETGEHCGRPAVQLTTGRGQVCQFHMVLQRDSEARFKARGRRVNPHTSMIYEAFMRELVLAEVESRAAGRPRGQE